MKRAVAVVEQRAVYPPLRVLHEHLSVDVTAVVRTCHRNSVVDVGEHHGSFHGFNAVGVDGNSIDASQRFEGHWSLVPNVA